MVNMSKISVNGEPIDIVKRNYIFNKGVMFDPLILTNSSIVDGVIVLNNGSIVKSVNKYVDCNVFIKVRKIGSATIDFFVNSTGVSMKSTISITNKTFTYGYTAMNEIINCNLAGSNSLDILEIWYEEVLT
ncbi:MAG: hypothetical protein ACK5L6_03945 [Anaerorhabdus sp.]|uniref:hypothetical protein n=1 Tax=Anaerorhabdus sp. TaxID=1872524 RepID=UPI003A8B5515